MSLRAVSVYLSQSNRRRLRWLARAGYGENADAVADRIVTEFTDGKFPHLAEWEARLEATEKEILGELARAGGGSSDEPL